MDFRERAATLTGVIDCLGRSGYPRTSGCATLISVGLVVGPHSGVQVWTGENLFSLGAVRVVTGASSPVLSLTGGWLRMPRTASCGGAAGGRRRRADADQLPTGSPVAFAPTGGRIAFIAEGAIIQLPGGR